ncbi:hypothetical protein M758_7G131100 [Ceratodon purpureus]|nr:hypothetical protein M758_7G131100 [Ceratodon purpureus]
MSTAVESVVGTKRKASEALPSEAIRQGKAARPLKASMEKPGVATTEVDQPETMESIVEMLVSSEHVLVAALNAGMERFQPDHGQKQLGLGLGEERMACDEVLADSDDIVDVMIDVLQLIQIIPAPISWSSSELEMISNEEAHDEYETYNNQIQV